MGGIMALEGRRLRFLTGAALLTGIAALGAITYYEQVLKPQWLREAVSTYIDSKMLPAHTAANEAVAESRAVISDFIDSKQTQIPLFVDDIMSYTHKLEQLSNDEDAQRRLVQVSFEQYFFTSDDLQTIVNTSIESYYLNFSEIANNLSRQIEGDYPYDVDQSVGVNTANIIQIHKDLIDYSKVLSDTEFYNEIARTGAGVVVSAVAPLILLRAAAAAGAAKGGGSGFPLVAIAAIVIAGAVDMAMQYRAEGQLTEEVTKTLEIVKGRLAGQVGEALTAQNHRHLKMWQDGLFTSMLAYREKVE
jgi:hypothetical protein